jgi:hypothetical protein
MELHAFRSLLFFILPLFADSNMIGTRSVEHDGPKPMAHAIGMMWNDRITQIIFWLLGQNQIQEHGEDVRDEIRGLWPHFRDPIELARLRW